MRIAFRFASLLVASTALVAQVSPLHAADPPAAPASPPAPVAATETPEKGKGLIRLAKDQDVWIDMERKIVVTDGAICLRSGRLEMFACPKGTKEHEAIIAVRGQGKLIHAGLLAVGAIAGRTVRFVPEYRPASGTPVDIFVVWEDDKGVHNVDARQMIRDRKTGKPMTHTWVFAGSSFWEDPDTKEKYYRADGGDLVCLSNMPSAMLDLPIPSSSANDDLEFDALSDNIPPIGAKVKLVFAPRLNEKPKPDEAKPDKPKEDKPANEKPKGEKPAETPPKTDPPKAGDKS